jgi:hypothetical protein
VRATPAVSIDPLRVVVAGASQLFAAIPLRWSSTIRNLPRAEASSAPVLGASIALWAVAIVLVFSAWRRRRVGAPDSLGVVAMIAWAAVSIAPTTLSPDMHVPLAAGALAASARWSMPAVAALSVALAIVASRSARGAEALAAIVVVWSIATASTRAAMRDRYADEVTLLDVDEAAYEATPAQYRSIDDVCAHGERALARALGHPRPGAVEPIVATLPAPCLERSEVLLDRLSAAVSEQRWTDARPFAERALVATFEPRAIGQMLSLAG